MCALWSCPGNAWNATPAKASICSKAGSFGTGLGGFSKLSQYPLLLTPHTCFDTLHIGYEVEDLRPPIAAPSVRGRFVESD